MIEFDEIVNLENLIDTNTTIGFTTGLSYTGYELYDGDGKGGGWGFFYIGGGDRYARGEGHND